MDKAQMLKMIMQHLGYTSNSELAEYFSVSSSRVSNWISRKTFDAEIVFTKCEKWINPSWLLSGGKGKMLRGDNVGIESLEQNLSQTLKYDLLECVSKFPCICLTDCETHIKYVNDSFERQTGYILDEVIGKKVGKVLQHDDFSLLRRKRIRALLDKGEPFYGEISPNYTKGGRKLNCKIYIIPLLNNGRVSSFISFADFVPYN